MSGNYTNTHIIVVRALLFMLIRFGMRVHGSVCALHPVGLHCAVPLLQVTGTC
jgi:hypothetical protein